MKYQHLVALSDADKEEVIDTWPETGWRVQAIGQDSHGLWWLLMRKKVRS